MGSAACISVCTLTADGSNPQPIQHILVIYNYTTSRTFHQFNSRLVTLLKFICASKPIHLSNDSLHIVCLKIINFVFSIFPF